MMQTAFRVAVAFCAIGPLCIAVTLVVRMSYADYLAAQDTVGSLDQAIAITPAKAELHSRIAALEPSKEEELRTALYLNPQDASSWITLAAQEEQRGDVLGAERSLVQAAESWPNLFSHDSTSLISP